ncbi:MAG: hypothetical protein RLW62_06795 [Gammaproteobacteria bacterium]
MQTLLQRWKRGRSFTTTVNLALLVALLSLSGGEFGTPREAIADAAAVELLAEVSELTGGADGTDSDAETTLLAGIVLAFVSALEPHLLRVHALPARRHAWRTPAVRAPPTLA